MLGAPAADALLFVLLGLLIGSFLNVVIHRLPRMMEAEWAAQCAELSGQPAAAQTAALKFNLVRPASRCPHCGHAIRWYENIPVISFLLLRGRCSSCSARISIRYPIVELVTASLFWVVTSRYGVAPAAFAWAALCGLLVAQFCIDFDTQLLPDDLNYLILWGGLIASLMHWSGPSIESATWGAVAGYLCLWTIYQVHHLLTGKEGMGHGDFKLLAGLGAWFGWEFLIALVLLSSLVGAVIGIGLMVAGRMANRNIPIPFGPFLAGAGLLTVIVGPGRLEAWAPFVFPFKVLAH